MKAACVVYLCQVDGVRACVRACVRVCVCVCACARARPCTHANATLTNRTDGTLTQKTLCYNLLQGPRKQR